MASSPPTAEYSEFIEDCRAERAALVKGIAFWKKHDASMKVRGVDWTQAHIAGLEKSLQQLDQLIADYDRESNA